MATVFTHAKHGGHREVTGTGGPLPKLEAMKSADLHFHLLPGVDDGPADLHESLYLARAAVAEGTQTIVATPHVRFDLGTTDAAEVLHRVCELRALIAAFSLPVDILCGGELGHDVIGSLSQYELELLAQGPPGARWLLVEAPFEGIGADFHAAAAELRERGFGVLIAHPERSPGARAGSTPGARGRFPGAGERAVAHGGARGGRRGRGLAPDPRGARGGDRLGRTRSHPPSGPGCRAARTRRGRSCAGHPPSSWWRAPGGCCGAVSARGPRWRPRSSRA